MNEAERHMREAMRTANDQLAQFQAANDSRARAAASRNISEGVRDLQKVLGQVSDAMGKVAEASAATLAHQADLVEMQTIELDHMREQVELTKEQRAAAMVADELNERRARQSLLAAWVSIGVAVVSVGVAAISILVANG